jgi:hypothetical protein
MRYHQYEPVYELLQGGDEEIQGFVRQLQEKNEPALPTGKQKAIKECFYKIFKPFKEWIPPQQLDLETNGRYLWNEGDSMRHRAEQRRAELLPLLAAPIADVKEMFDEETSVVDTSIVRNSSRLQAGLKMKAILGVPSLVESFQMPPHFVDIIRRQLEGDGIDDSPVDLYSAMKQVPLHRRVKIPTSTRKRGSALYEDFKRCMRYYGMKEVFEGPPSAKSAIKTARNGNPSTLHPGFGFEPLCKELSNRLQVYVPHLRTKVALEDLDTLVDSAAQDHAASVGLEDDAQDLVPLDIQPSPDAYTERFDRDRLVALKSIIY